MNPLVTIVTENTTSTHSTSTFLNPNHPICQVFLNASYLGNCQALVQSTGFPSLLFFPMMGGIVMGFGMLIIRVYYERPFGRFIWKRTDTVAVMKFTGAPATLGILKQYSEKLWLFTSSGIKKERIVRLIGSMPGGIIQLRQKDGGASFAVIDGDKGSTVNPKVMEWAESALGELADTHDWSTFAAKWKYAELVDALKPKFPEVKDWNPGEQVITIVRKDGSQVQKKAIECTPEEKSWYETFAVPWDQKRLQVMEHDKAEERLRAQAILTGADHYNLGNRPVKFDPRDKSEFVHKLTKEMMNTRSQITDALIGGKVISTQYIAAVLDGYPDGVYIDGLRAEIEEKERKKNKTSLQDIMPYVIAIIGIIAAMVLGIVILHSQGL